MGQKVPLYFRVSTDDQSCERQERDLLSERIRSGLAAARAKGKQIGRGVGQRPKADSVGPKVLALKEQGLSARGNPRKPDISKNTVTAIVKRHRQAQPQEGESS